MTKIEQIQKCIENAKQRTSKLSKAAIDVPFLGSLQIRHLMNNLGEISTKYFEVGCHKGGSFCSAVYENYNLKWGYAVDSFESDRIEGETAEFQFLVNAMFFKPHTMEIRLMRGDCFQIDLSKIHAPFDFYLFDGSHDEESQCKGLTYYAPIMANEFIFCCDDYDWKEVQAGTQRGIKEANLEILFEQHLPSAISLENGGHDNESWWNGYYVALLKKKP